MKWGWRLENSHTWRYDAEWQIARDWAANDWFIIRGGRWMLESYPSAMAAIEAAERFMEAK